MNAWFLRAEVVRCEEWARTYARRAIEAQSIPGCRTLAVEFYALAEDWQSRADAAREALAAMSTEQSETTT